MAMNSTLQNRQVREALRKCGVDPETVDTQALIDPTLTLPENLDRIGAQIGHRLYADGEEEFWARQELLYQDYVANGGLNWMTPTDDDPTHDPTAAHEHNAEPTPPPAPHPLPPPLAPAAPLVQLATPPAPNPGTTATVRRLSADPDTRHALQRAIQHETNTTDDFTQKYGWDASAVPIPPHIIRKLKDAALVRVAYSSNRYTHYLLTDRDATATGLQDAERGHAIPPPVDDPALLQEFAQIAARGDALGVLLGYVAPQVHGLTDAKRAVLLAIASLDDDAGTRGRIHVLLSGPPGTAKTDLLRWAGALTNTEVWSPRITGAGLTVDLRNGEPGILPRLHTTEWRTACVDEVEKCPPQVLRQTLQALEEGEFSYSSANATGTHKAAVRFIGAANETSDLPPEFVDRQDFLIHVPLPDRDRAKEIANQITQHFMRTGKAKDLDYVRSYLRWVRPYKPGFADAERDLVARMVCMLIDLSNQDAVRVRPLLSVLRVAHVLAKLNRQDVRGEHALEAITILHPELRGRLEPLRVMLNAHRGRPPTLR